jgi:hypothetical protein
MILTQFVRAFRIRPGAVSAAILLTTAALSGCGSNDTAETSAPDGSGRNNNSDGTPPPGAPGGNTPPGSQPNAATPLACSSLSFCTSISVAGYHGKTIVPAPTGGTIKDGLYQLAYELVGDDEYASSGGVYESAQSLSALMIQEGRFRWAGFAHGSAGAVQTSGTTVTFKNTDSCDDATGERTSAYDRTETYEYSVDATGTLLLFGEASTQSGKVRYARAYIPASSACAETVARVPKTPAPSANCSVRNCGCSAAIGKPANADTCKFVQGG